MENLEIWKDIPEWEGYYQASSMGRIRSVDRYIQTKQMLIFRKGKILKIQKGIKYLQVGLNKCGSGVITKTVHFLICTTFHKKPSHDYEVMHKNNIKHDNRADNLRWGTHLENIQDSIRDGLKKRSLFGWERPKCKFSKDVYKNVFKLYSEGKHNRTQISRLCGIKSGTVKTWLRTYNKHKVEINKLLEI
jgi:NUMOD4 motif-containing protein/HNH endonuclease